MSSRPWVVALALAVVASALACSGSGPRPPRQRMTVKEIVERSKPAIVRIEADRERVGTGFIIRPDGVIATNLHVVAGASKISVRLLDGTTHDVARVLSVDADRDLTLLQIDAPRPVPYLELGDSDAVAAGDPVIAIGNPLGVLDYTVSDGLISSVRVLSEELTILQISAPISQGSSGGPLFNPYGEVIGVATAIFTGGQNLNFAVPSKYLRPMLAAPEVMTMPEFAAATAFPDDRKGAPEVKIERRVPVHDLAVLDGCSPSELAEVAKAITDAIELGAPLYNAGNHEACFRIYEGTSIKLEKDAKCAGVRDAFREGLRRAGDLESFTEKAWALRDTFDGMLDVLVRRARAAGVP